MARLTWLLVVAVLATVLPAAASDLPPMDDIYVEAMVLDSAPFHDCQNKFSGMHGHFTRMEQVIQERLTSVQRDFDERAGDMMEHDARVHDTLARAELYMAELIEEVRGSTLLGPRAVARVYRWPLVALAVLVIGVGVQHAFLGASVSRARKGVFSLPGAMARGMGGSAAWV